jgi:membrane associated rhomboid family serine protease
MFRSRGENLRATYVLLFLNIAFYLLQFQDEEVFIRLFAFDRDGVMSGQIWRLFTYQFAQATRIGPWVIWPGVTLMINLLLLTLMGFSLEEEWGTTHFVRLYLLSTLATAVVAGYFHTPLAGSYFINFTLLFVYASIHRNQALYLIFIPIRFTFLALFSAGVLVFGVFVGSRQHLAALVGAAFGFAYYLSQRVRATTPAPGAAATIAANEVVVRTATKNVARVAAMKKALSTASQKDIDRLIAVSERETVRGVNICAPVDYKPDHADRYCIRCEGFAECTARHLRLNRPQAAS